MGTFELIGKNTIWGAHSFFSGGGFGDLGVEYGCNLPVLTACELLEDRADLIRDNFPNTHVFEGDIWGLKNEITSKLDQMLGTYHPWLMLLSPPCQGMSSNGAGRIQSAIRSGARPQEDERNRLLLPGLELVEKFKPDWFILENVKRMENTIIRNEMNEPENILDTVTRRTLPLGYTVRSTILDFRKLGVPHNRERLITIGCRIPEITKLVKPIKQAFTKSPSYLHPISTFGPESGRDFLTISDTIGHLPKLDAQKKMLDSKDALHRVPKWNDKHYFWMSSTPEGKSALDNNNCKSCSYENTEKDLYCKCGELLAKPSILRKSWKCKCGDIVSIKKNNCPSCGLKATDEIVERLELIRAFKTSYRRMRLDRPASTLTMNSGVISSDMKGHPVQNRVLSLREILILSTFEQSQNSSFPWSGKYSFGKYDKQSAEDKIIRQVVGESIPPLASATIVRRLMEIDTRVTLKLPNLLTDNPQNNFSTDQLKFQFG
jgi:DNA (cytosine-5)-methyltransferase 1